jgi:hypothetical protein
MISRSAKTTLVSSLQCSEIRMVYLFFVRKISASRD